MENFATLLIAASCKVFLQGSPSQIFTIMLALSLNLRYQINTKVVQYCVQHSYFYSRFQIQLSFKYHKKYIQKVFDTNQVLPLDYFYIPCKHQKTYIFNVVSRSGMSSLGWYWLRQCYDTVAIVKESQRRNIEYLVFEHNSYMCKILLFKHQCYSSSLHYCYNHNMVYVQDT